MIDYRGRLYIDGKDAFSYYGIFVEQYGYKALIQQPSFKKLTSTEWPELDGEEVDLTAPVLDTRSLSIQFCITDKRLTEDLFNALSQNGSYHLFVFSELKRSYNLRMTSNGSFSSNIKLGKLTLSFSQDDCTVPTGEPMDLGASGVKQRGYEIDDIDLSCYGVNILKGTDDAIRKAPSVRENLSVSTKDKDGVKYDSEEVHYKTKDVAFKLLIRADNINDFWKRWDALFCALMQPESRLFYFVEMEAEFECYYKSSSVSKFDILRNGHVWCEFTVTMTFLSCTTLLDMVLATEDGIIVYTEDDEYAIDMEYHSGEAVRKV